MGLSASQARLLTITSRKSDCEFQSMRLSHEKIALSRSMTDISNEYQNSLDQTKLIYDFYGNNDKSVDVSYGLLMQPSEINKYMPIITTDATGKVVLDSKYASAARAAGIPVEGLGTLPSDILRNRFLDALGATGIINPTAAEAYKQVPYSQTVGIGDTATVNEVVTNMNFEQMVEYLRDFQVDLNYGAEFGGESYSSLTLNDRDDHIVTLGSDDVDLSDSIGVFENYEKTGTVSIADILSGDKQYTLMYKCCIADSEDGASYNRRHQELLAAEEMESYWNIPGCAGRELLDTLRSMLSVSNPAAQTALNYADMMIANITNLATNMGDEWYAKLASGDYSSDYHISGIAGNDNKSWTAILSKDKNQARAYMANCNIISNTDNYIGYYMREARLWKPGSAQTASLSIDIGNVLRAYLTYFADAMDNFSGKYSVDDSKDDLTVKHYHGMVNQNDMATVKQSKLVGTEVDGKLLDYDFNVVIDQNANTSDALVSSFYDALFNQICMRGWVENNNVTNKEYLQDMYKNGMMFVTAVSDDGYYYQNNYGSFNYIKEVTDEDAIARAEAKYNTEKAKLNHKEEVLDLKMKNLDTEINSLTTEYDTIKSLISKNIERGFKRYDA